jgi:hypothetical protein
MPNAQRHVTHGLLCEEARLRMASTGGNFNWSATPHIGLSTKSVSELWMQVIEEWALPPRFTRNSPAV